LEGSAAAACDASTPPQSLMGVGGDTGMDHNMKK
jgi:hypothetical protein